jgi:hypothetical protein
MYSIKESRTLFTNSFMAKNYDNYNMKCKDRPSKDWPT